MSRDNKKKKNYIGIFFFRCERHRSFFLYRLNNFGIGITMYIDLRDREAIIVFLGFGLTYWSTTPLWFLLFLGGVPQKIFKGGYVHESETQFLFTKIVVSRPVIFRLSIDPSVILTSFFLTQRIWIMEVSTIHSTFYLIFAMSIFF